MNKKITLFLFISSFWSICYSIFPFLWNNSFEFISYVLQGFNLDIVSGQYSSDYQKVINQFFNLTLLTGVIIYIYTKEKDFRLLRFLFAVILINKIALAVTSIIFLLESIINFDRTFGLTLTPLISFIWVYFSWRMLHYFNKQKVLVIDKVEYNDYISENYIAATTSQRLLHFLVDTLIMIFAFSCFFNILLKFDSSVSLLKSISNLVGEKPAILIIVSVFKFLYYFFFETFFKATPAKFLSETRTVYGNGELISPPTGFSRTLLRFVPFDSLSFIFAYEGWHDKWSNTFVIKEKRTGIKGGYYLLIILGLILLQFFLYLCIQYSRHF